MGSSGLSADEFQALEQKVLRAVEIVKREREARAAAEEQARALREQFAAQAAELKGQVEATRSQLEAARLQAAAAQERVDALLTEKESAEGQIGALNHERDVVRQRVERMLSQMDELL
jgi:chromosome segregation ATPase